MKNEQSFAFGLDRETITKSGVDLEIRYPKTGGAVFRVKVPADYRYPQVPREENKPLREGESLSLATPIQTFGAMSKRLVAAVPDIERITKRLYSDPHYHENKDILAWPELGSMRITMHATGNEWRLPVDLPDIFINAFASALLHEAAINPDLGRLECIFDIRTHRRERRNITADLTHFDFSKYADNPSVSKYFFGAGAMTLQYHAERFNRTMVGKTPKQILSGEDGDVAVSSILPNTVSRMNHRYLHSSPDPSLLATDVEETSGEEMRVLGTVSFW